MKFTDSILFIIDYEKRNIKIEFNAVIDNIYRFKLEIELKDIDGKFHFEEQAYQRLITIIGYSETKKTCGKKRRPYIPDSSEQLVGILSIQITKVDNKKPRDIEKFVMDAFISIKKKNLMTK